MSTGTSAEEYLEALYTLTQGGKTARTSEISKRLNIAPASVTEMLPKLAASGYLNYAPYQGVTLTPSGFELAAKMARKHRLLERFLHDILHIGNDKVHKEACAMEHALSDETERALCQTLKAPDLCPDDKNVIPACNLGFSTCQECQEWGGRNLEEAGKRKTSVVPIASLKENQEGTISFIRGDNSVLRRLLDLGLTPGTKIKVNRIAPFKGPVEIAVRGSKLALGDEIVCNVFVDRQASEFGGGENG
ncbi:metal-dependent transcriptional regulator [Dehalogenimonas sp. 4OHTPN]|uniref:Manganese transport regulator n=1 Tax=Dehalogenimonas sp. 4OHTPN TaxID=3166643 RepID=A0AAU8GE80_9CHLR